MAEALDIAAALTRAATDEIVVRLDALQYEFAQGPCLEAIQRRCPMRAHEHEKRLVASREP